MTTKKTTKFAFLAVATAMALTLVAEDAPRKRHLIYGRVTVDGSPVPDSVAVSAEIDGVELAATEVFTSIEGSAYLIDIPGDISETPGVEGGREGEVVTLRVGGAEAPESAVWKLGENERLDLTAAAGPDLSITVDDGVDAASPGETLSYVLTVVNHGPADATAVTIEDVLGPGTLFVSASDGGAAAGDLVTWPPFDLASGLSTTRTLSVEVGPELPAGTSEIVNAASVRSSGSDGVDLEPSNNLSADRDALIGGGPDLVVAKSAEVTEAAPGDEILYSLTLRNQGFQDAVDVELVDALPAAVVFAAASDGGSHSAGTVSWPRLRLAIGESVTRTVTVRLPEDVPPAVSQLTNTASATSANGPDVEPGDNSATHVLTVLRQSDLTVLAVDASATRVDLATLAITGQVSVELANHGNAEALAAFDVAVFEDLDGDGAFGAGSDNLLGEASFADGILAGETVAMEVPVAGSVLFRDNLIYAYVDAGDAVAELDETDNVRRSGEDCEYRPGAGEFEPAVELAWPGEGESVAFPDSVDVLSTPLVVPLVDDGGDGRVDEADTPAIVFVSFKKRREGEPMVLRAIRGDTGAAIFDVAEPAVSGIGTLKLCDPAAGDVDLDGRVEIVTCGWVEGTVENRLVAFEHDGAVKWVSEPYHTHPRADRASDRDAPAIADLDGDGQPEIVVGAHVFTAGGTLSWRGGEGQGFQSSNLQSGGKGGAVSIAADLDLDGRLEVVAGRTAYRHDGTIYWSRAEADGYAALGDFDDDPYPEVVLVAAGQVRVLEHDGTLKWGPHDVPGGGAEAGGPPTVADLDGDGEAEIAVAGAARLVAYEADGSEKWTVPISDFSSSQSSSAAFDLDGDGRSEIVYRDQLELRIVRGSDGASLAAVPFSSATHLEHPVVADVDLDGNAEIVVPTDQALGFNVPRRTRGIRVLGDRRDTWTSARAIWNQHAYHVDNVRGDATVPAHQARGWLTHNTYRANLAGERAFAAPDVTASRLIVESGELPHVTLTVRVGNGGAAAVGAGLPVAFYDGDPAAGAPLAGVAGTSRRLLPGEHEDVALGWSLSSLGTHDLHVVADRDADGRGLANECDEGNNRLAREVSFEGPIDLAVTVDDGRTTAVPGTTWTYTLTIENRGRQEATGVVVTDELAPETFFLAASDGGTEVGGTVRWPAFSLPAGGTATRTVRVAAYEGLTRGLVLTNVAAVADDGSHGDDLGTANDVDSDVDVSEPGAGTDYLSFWIRDLRILAQRDGTRVALIDIATGELLSLGDSRIISTNVTSNPFVLSRRGDAFEGVARRPLEIRVVASDAADAWGLRPITAWTGDLSDGLRHPPEPPSGPLDPWMSYVPAFSEQARANGRELGRELLGFTSREMYVFARRGAEPTAISITDLATNTDADADDGRLLTAADAVYADDEIEIYYLDDFEDDTFHLVANVDVSVLVGAGSASAPDWTVTPPSYAAGDEGIERGTLFYTFVHESLTVFPLEDETTVTVTDLSDGDDTVTLSLGRGSAGGDEYELFTPILEALDGDHVTPRPSAPAVTIHATGNPFDDDFVKVESDKPVLVFVGPAGSDRQDYADVAYAVPTGSGRRLFYGYAQDGGTKPDLQIFAYSESTRVTVTSLSRTEGWRTATFHDFVIGPGIGGAEGWLEGGEGAPVWWSSGEWSGELLRIESDGPITVINGDFETAHFGAFIPYSLASELLPPVAAAGPDQAALSGEIVTFDAGGSFDQDAFEGGETPRYAWDFDLATDGDGDGDPANDADATGAVAAHVFPAAGVYAVTLTYVDDDGEADTDVVMVTIEPDPDATTEVSIDDVEVAEDAGAAIFTVSLAAASSGQVVVAYQTEDAAAAAGQDYESAAGELVFAPGETSRSVTVSLIDDVTDELDETFTARLTSVAGGVVADGEGLGTILDDDEALITIDDVTALEGDAGTTDAVFTVTLATVADREIRVDYSTAAGTATADVDYLTATGTLLFPAFTTEQTLAVAVVGDPILEEDETFTVELSNAVETTIADGAGLGTILDDEACPGPNLLVNPGAERREVDGAIAGWTLAEGDWQRHFGPPEPLAGRVQLFAGAAALSELYQDVDVSAYASRIAAGDQQFTFSGFVRTFDEVPPDVVRIVVEYRDAASAVVLDTFDSGEITSPLDWTEVTDVRAAPAGTGWIRVRLLATRFAGAEIDGFVDALELRSRRAPTVTVEGVTVYEGNADTTDAIFTARLACPYESDVGVSYASVDGTALAGEDYLPVSGSLFFPSGTTAQTIPVPVVGDEIDEPAETFLVGLSDVTSAGTPVLLKPAGVGTVLSDDFCPRSHGYWKTHTDQWPIAWVLMGGVEYEAEEMLAFLNAKGGDATLHLALQLVATKLNLARGSDPSIVPTVEAADAFLELYPPGSDPRGEARDEAERLKDELDAYNNLPCADDDDGGDGGNGGGNGNGNGNGNG